MGKCKDTILKMINSFNICVEQDTKKNEANINENDDDDNDGEVDDDDSDDDSDDDRDDDDSEADNDDDDDDDNVNKDFSKLSDKTINNLNIIGEIRKEILIKNSEINELINKAENMSRDDFLLKLDKFS